MYVMLKFCYQTCNRPVLMVCDVHGIAVRLCLQAFAAAADVLCEDWQSKAGKVRCTVYRRHVSIKGCHL